MKIEILNSNPDSIKDFLKYIKKHIPKNLCLSPISIDFNLVEYTEYDTTDRIELDIHQYDYYDDTLTPADAYIDDANLLFNEVVFEKNALQIDDNHYTLLPFISKIPPKRKKTKPPK